MRIEDLIQNYGIQSLNELQTEAFDKVKIDSNTIILAPTGSGKTLAYSLPIITSLNETSDDIQCLIITPTRELTIQTEEVIRKLKSGYKINAAYGGHAIKIEKNNFSVLPDILIGTPGRIIDHLERENLSLNKITHLVLDEYDKCLDMGFLPQIEAILSYVTSQPKQILVSATTIEKLPKQFVSNDFKTINHLGEKQPNLTFKRILSKSKDKLEILFRTICEIPAEPTIVFCNHREPVERISAYLTEHGIDNSCFHGGLDQIERERALIKFRNGSTHVLVTTDLGSRGLDIPEIKSVIHYHFPLQADAFIHRNGRTARMNKSGCIYLLTSLEENLPSYLPTQIEDFELSNKIVNIPSTEWITLYFSAGKKDKINKIDIVGFLGNKGKLQKADIGLIHVLDYMSFAAIRKTEVKSAFNLIRNEKIKGKKVRIGISK